MFSPNFEKAWLRFLEFFRKKGLGALNWRPTGAQGGQANQTGAAKKIGPAHLTHERLLRLLKLAGRLKGLAHPRLSAFPKLIDDITKSESDTMIVIEKMS